MSTATSTILVVEDDKIVRTLIVDVLKELDYTVFDAADAKGALAHLGDAQKTIDLLMTDQGLPDMTGSDLAIAARQLRPTLPVLFASGYAENIEVPAGMHIIGKPFSIDQLRNKVNGILDPKV